MRTVQIKSNERKRLFIIVNVARFGFLLKSDFKQNPDSIKYFPTCKAHGAARGGAVRVGVYVGFV